MVTNISHSVEETFAIGETWGKAATAGLVIGLSGDLGAGKTQLVKGIASGLGCDEAITSPTFTLVNIYESGKLPLYHLDLYRLETDAQIVTAGLDEYFEPEGIAVIEWVERWKGASPSYFRNVKIKILSETEREITYEDSGN